MFGVHFQLCSKFKNYTIKLQILCIIIKMTVNTERDNILINLNEKQKILDFCEAFI